MKPRGDFDINLEKFWLRTREVLDPPLLQYHLNLTSSRLHKTDDGQFYVGVRGRHEFPFGLIVSNGYYGRLVLDGIYKARILIKKKWRRIQCFDAVIELTQGESLEILRLDKTECNSLLDGKPAGKLDYEDNSQTWAVKDYFNPSRD